MFFKGSRYAKVPDQELTDASGRTIRYKGTRFIPPTAAQVGHIITDGERLDLIAYYYYRDPERFWRICDCNEVMDPDELNRAVGRKIGIPSSEAQG
jgi:hypothetical protein